MVTAQRPRPVVCLYLTDRVCLRAWTNHAITAVACEHFATNPGKRTGNCQTSPRVGNCARRRARNNFVYVFRTAFYSGLLPCGPCEHQTFENRRSRTEPSFWRTSQFCQRFAGQTKRSVCVLHFLHCQDRVYIQRSSLMRPCLCVVRLLGKNLL